MSYKHIESPYTKYNLNNVDEQDEKNLLFDQLVLQNKILKREIWTN